MEIPMICWNGELPKLKNNSQVRKLMANFKETSSKVILSLYITWAHVAQNSALAINYFSHL